MVCRVDPVLFKGRRVVVYLRISSDPLGMKRGVKRQRRAAVRAVAAGDGSMVEVIEENDTSAFKKRRIRVSDGEGGFRWAWRVVRPLWEHGLKMVRDGQADCLLVVYMDRMVREPRDLEDAIELVEHYGALVLDLSGALDLRTDHGVMMARLMTAHANQSSRDTSRRLTAAKAADAQKGLPNRGARAFGYKGDGLRVKKGEAAEVVEAYRLLLAGRSAYSIVAAWNARGLRTPKGKRWTPSTLRIVVTNPRNAGLRSTGFVRDRDDRADSDARGSAGQGAQSRGWACAEATGAAEQGARDVARVKTWDVLRAPDGRLVKGAWPAIVPVGVWAAVCKLYADRTESDGGRNTRVHLLSGIARCGECGAVMYGGATQGGHMYRCSVVRGGCGAVSRRGAPVDELVVSVALGKWEAESADRVVTGPVAVAQWPGTADLARTDRLLSEAYGQWKGGGLPGSEYFVIRHDLEAEASRLRRDHAVWSRAHEALAAPVMPLDLRAAWELPVEDGGLTLAEKRDFLSRQLVAVEVHRHPADPVTGTRSRRWDPALIVPRWRTDTPGQPGEDTDHSADQGAGQGEGGAAVAA